MSTVTFLPGMTCVGGLPSFIIGQKVWHADGNPDAEGHYHYLREPCACTAEKPITDTEIAAFFLAGRRAVTSLKHPRFSWCVLELTDGAKGTPEYYKGLGMGNTPLEAVHDAIRKGRK